MPARRINPRQPQGGAVFYCGITTSLVVVIPQEKANKIWFDFVCLWWGQQVIRLTAKASCKCRRFLFMDATQAAEPAREGTLSRTTG